MVHKASSQFTWALIKTAFQERTQAMNSSVTSKYPLLLEILGLRNLELQPMYSIRDLAKIFNVSVRAIQNRVASGQLPPRDLPGRARFLPLDLENFIRTSRKGEN